VKEINIEKMKNAYLTKEDMVETDNYFQQAIIMTTEKNENVNETTLLNRNNPTSISTTPNITYDSDKKFDQYLLEAIDETFSSLGEVVKKAVFEHLQNDFQIKSADIPKKICNFSKIIHKIFGLGADRLELKIINSLNSKLQVDIKLTEYQWPLSKWIVNEVSLTDYVQNLRNNYSEAVKKKT
jgi:hypothetical protein